MQQTFLVLALVAVVLAAVWLFRRQPAKAVASHRPKARGVESLDTLMAWQPAPTRVLTAPECQAYNLLRRALPDHMILAQVPLARFLKVPTRHSYSEWLRRVGQLCVDLVVCDHNSQVVGVVDIRQAEAQESDRAKKRRARMDRVLQASGIPLHVWREDLLPTPAVAREVFLETSKRIKSLAGHGFDAGADIAPDRNHIDLDRGALASEPRDPPPSTWFDDLDSAPMPLGSSPASPRR